MTSNGYDLTEGSVRWRLEGFSGVRASFLQVILKVFDKYNDVCTEERITAFREAISLAGR